MIPKKFHLFWHNGPMSYLRYTTFKTLRHHHPDWEINLYYSKIHTETSWKDEDQDFLGTCCEDLTSEIHDLVDNVRSYNEHPEVAPNFQSDFFRWDILWEEGGFYLDSDQMILKNFSPLCDFDFVGARYGGYTPVGVIGAARECPIVGKCREIILSRYNPEDYNSIGPYMFKSALEEVERTDWYRDLKTAITPPGVFYPIAYSPDACKLYRGEFDIPDGSYACHWFGGHPDSQEFNRSYTREICKTSDDSISKYIRTLEGQSS